MTGSLDRIELHKAIQELLDKNISLELLEKIFKEFDKDSNEGFDDAEFRLMAKYILNEEGCIQVAILKSKVDTETRLRSIAKYVYPSKDLLCIQDSSLYNIGKDESKAVDLDTMINEEDAVDIDPDFKAAFSPAEMRCLALVSHNGMKPSMRKFVEAHKNLLKKFRLTGTNSTITMLKEVFAKEPLGTVVYGPPCASGPLGGDAELVGHMVRGHIGGVIFFRDPMQAHPHRVDIDCCLRQAVVNNVPLAETPAAAMLMLHPLRMAIQGEGKPEIIPSFFFQLQSPTVEDYKSEQDKVIDDNIDEIGKEDS
jgi:methylglyoxal synthase